MPTKIIKLVRRARRKKKPKVIRPIYDICVVEKSEGGSLVIEKIGTWSTVSGVIRINLFRLAHWLSQDVGMTGNCARCLELAGIVEIV